MRYKYEKIFYLFATKEYAPYTRNAQEILQFHEQKRCQKCSKYYYSVSRSVLFWFLFPVLGLAHQDYSAKSLYLRATYLLSNF